MVSVASGMYAKLEDLHLSWMCRMASALLLRHDLMVHPFIGSKVLKDACGRYGLLLLSHNWVASKSLCIVLQASWLTF